MKHCLKIWPQYYEAVASGDKTFEVRVNDRNFQRGDLVELRYFDPDFKRGVLFSESELTTMWDKKFPRLTFNIGYVLTLEDGIAVFSLLPLKE